MTVRCNVSQWPLVMIEVTGIADRAHSDCLLQTLSTQIERGRCAVLLDSRGAQLSDSVTAVENVKREAQWLNEHELLIERDVIAFGLVLDSVAVRFLFSSLLSMASIRTKWLATTHLFEAEQFCRLALLRERASVPAMPAVASLSSMPPPSAGAE